MEVLGGSAYVHTITPANAISGHGGNGTSYSGGGYGCSAMNYDRGNVSWKFRWDTIFWWIGENGNIR